jgi:TatD DNase family protein
MPGPLIDTHAHLTDERFSADFAELLARSTAAGVVHTLTVATTAADSAACISLATQFPNQLSAAVGIHPNEAAEAVAGDWDTVVALADRPHVHAIGETGLDRYWDRTPFPLQEEYFARHLELSRRTGKPIVIHDREADADIIRMLRQDFEHHGPVRGVLHSFCGDWATAEAGLAMGLHVSFAGMLTYKNADNVRSAAVRVPLDRLLVETDCPYLAPVPVRGKRNEPAFVAHTAARLAELHGLTPERLAELTARNARFLFDFPADGTP